MYILLAAATGNEISPTIEWLKNNNGAISGNEVEVLITGIGGTAAAYAITRQLLWRAPDLVIQAGIAGSFRDELPPESLVFVKEEVFADLGVNENEEFTDVFDLGLAGSNDHPYTSRMLVNSASDAWKSFGLHFVRGATVNCISSTSEQVNIIRSKYDPDIETMEGAALHYACIMENIPFIQLRAVSNFTGERNKKNWKMNEAIAGLNGKLREMLGDGKGEGRRQT
jgi:futalosine hydrolase